MASQAYEQILEVQAVDMSLTRLRHRRDHHPTRALIEQIDAELAANDAAAAEVAQRLHELERRQKRLEDEVATIAAKRKDVDGKLYGGEVTASKDLLALQDEAALLLKRQTDMEDDDLEIMEQIEAVDGEAAELAGNRAVVESQRRDRERELADELAEIETEIAELEARRSAAAEPANPELLDRYERLRGQYDGVPVARLVDGRCDGCHIQLSAVAVDQLSKMADDAVVTCEECGRLLVR